MLVRSDTLSEMNPKPERSVLFLRYEIADFTKSIIRKARTKPFVLTSIKEVQTSSIEELFMPWFQFKIRQVRISEKKFLSIVPSL